MTNLLSLTPYQKYFYLAWQLDPKSPMYNESVSFKLNKKPNINKLTKALEYFLDTHQIAQMRYDPIKHKLTRCPFSINAYFHQLSATKDTASKQINILTEKPFDLHHGPCIQFYLFSLKQHWYFVVCAHHIICDAISARVMICDIANRYNAQSKIKIAPLPYHRYQDAVTITYHQYLSNYDQSKQYWQHYLCQAHLFTPLSHQCLNSRSETDFVDFKLNRQMVQTLARKYRTTAFILLTGCYGFLLSRYMQQQKLMLSYPVNIRNKDCSHAIGCFINNIPLKIDLYKNNTFSDLIQTLNVDRKKSKAYWHFPAFEIFNDHKKQRNQSTAGHNYINIGISQTNLNTTAFNLCDIQTSCVDTASSTRAHYDLLLLFDEQPQQPIKFRLKFNNTFLGKIFIENFITQFHQLTHHLLKNDINLITYQILTPKQYHQVIYAFNQTDKTRFADSIVSLFISQAEKTPNHIGLLANTNKLSYQTLIARITCLSQRLASFTQKPIAVYMPNDLDFYISFWAILFVDGIYLPLDLRHPAQRLYSLLQKANCNTVITTKKRAPFLSHINELTLIILDDEISHENHTSTIHLPTAYSMAYVLFTSGTTGQPKGVLVSHTALSNRITWMQKIFQLTNEDVVLQKTTPCFDVSLWEMIWPVCYGARIVIPDADSCHDFQRLYQVMVQENTTIIHFVPSMLQAFLAFLQSCQLQLPKSLRLMICSGEALTPLLVTQAYECADNPDFALYNLYGPTEACIDVTFHHCQPQQPVYIGKPIDNTEIYILDKNEMPLPTGIVGELYIGGTALAEGYINDKTLTEQAFINHPFKPNKRLYRSGDLALWDNHGCLVYIGRADNEIKINGQRVCLYEIETAILQNDLVQSCVALYENDCVVAFYTTKNAQALHATALHKKLQSILPEYMLPTHWQHLTSLPTTQSGKIDKEALQQQLTISKKAQSICLAKTAIEIQLSEIWKKVLNIDPVDIETDFTDLAIDSLKAISLLSYINKYYALNLHVADLYRLQSIKTLAWYIRKNKHNHHFIKYLAGKVNTLSIYFIHPAKAGCEVYQNIANQLASTYYCFGVDNYNLYCENQQMIHSLPMLASHYILQMKKSRTLSQAPIYLCGWSLGGLIALEIAYQLEQEGFYNLHVILLDTYVTDFAIKEMRAQVDKTAFTHTYACQLNAQKIKKHWYDRLVKLYPIESLLETQVISGKLYYTQATLFKAQQLIPANKTNPLYHQLNQYIIDLPLNNIDAYIPKEKIHCVALSCHHDNIIETLSVLAGFQVLQAILKGSNLSCNIL
ncbi:non-ribosomal peptide synthetase [Facilibium subflavum]|uniref:non-ribosomal peptide synthetase n=1 Tax=Facilibium subflavum TaxID=2219058 RepID=UPI000E6539D5|nr:non-ribosomal peptide synthetase [Facilibium subflavum]